MIKKIFSGIKAIGKKFFNSRLALGLSLLGVILLLSSYLLMQLVTLNKAWQWGGAFIVSMFYFLLIISCYGVNWLINKRISNRQIKQAEGKLQVKKMTTMASEKRAYQHYIYHKLRLRSYLPLAIQQWSRRSRLYVALGESPAWIRYLTENDWQALDNPQRFPLTVWVHGQYTLINLAGNDTYRLYEGLALLSRFCFFRVFAGILFITEKQMVEKHQLKIITESYPRLLKIATSYLLPDVVDFVGAREAFAISNVREQLLQPIELASNNTLEKLNFKIAEYMNTTINTVENAQLQLFLLAFEKLVTNLKKSLPISQRVNCLAYRQRNDETGLDEIWQQLRHNKQHGSIKRRQKLLTVSAIGLTMILFGLLTMSYHGNSSYLEKSREQLQAYQTAMIKSPQTMSLPMIEKGLMAYQVMPENNLFLHMGLYQGDKLAQITQPIYQFSLQKQFLPLLQQALKKLLIQSIAKDKQIDVALSRYLMLSQPEHYDAEKMVAWLQQQKSLLNDSRLTSMQSTLLFDKIQHTKFTPLATDTVLVDKAYHLLPSAIDSFSQALTQWEKSGGKQDLLANLSEAQKALFAHTMKVSYLYTKQQYQAIIHHLESSVLQRWLRNNWIYTIDNSLLARTLLATYQQHYLQAWQQVTQQFSLLSPVNIQQTNELAKQASQPDAFWLQLIKQVVDNTRLSTQGDDRISRYFDNWYQLQQSPEGRAISNKLIQQFNAMHVSVETIANDKMAGKVAFDQLSKSKITGIESFNALNSLSAKIPEDVSTWLQLIRQQLAQGLLVTAKTYINQQWQQQVLPVVGDKLTQYPFVKQSTNELSLQAFSQLFSEQSQLMKFLQQDISPFIRLSSGQVRYYYGAKLPLESSQVLLFTQLYNMSQNFFRDGQLFIRGVVKPIYLSNNMAKIEWQGLSHIWRYQHGPLNKKVFTLPSQKTDQIAYLRWYYANGKYATDTAQGEWAWLRLLQQAPAKKQGENWQLTFHHRQSIFRVQLYGAMAINLLFSHTLGKTELPTSL